MSTPVAVSEARAALPELLDRVAAGEEITLTRHGRAVAVLVRPDRLRPRRADEVLAASADVAAILEVGRRSRVVDQPGLSVERADELVSEVRVGRRVR